MDTTCLFNNFCAIFPVLSYAVKEYSMALTKAHKLKLQLKFLRQCYSEQVLPASILPNCLIKMSDRPFDEFQKNILLKHIEIKQLEVQEAFKISNAKRFHFDNTIPAEWKDCLMNFCFQNMRKAVYIQSKRNLNKKLELLVERSEWTNHANSDFVINLSDK